ncbi:type II toxin-antitoxin system RelE/ParE family toxin [Pedobacter cryoconitis]|uniref:ParE-like toxin of type II ParDE toxin-antitoxin system n=1 Tax=Pedobacter cryoconitis TaxID=188932 RepID=A0A327RZU2_9SPHI|nr:type II toxin-antitoxin system RelE/ParE family toxin [Pedobacter cryoconitis]RAJ22400.1 ParE-like toxin of type II ParDE toxin-antitoxin system [Pedobacter cryoconitis]
MPSYKIKVFPEALTDIQKATDWYNEQSYGLGTRFQKQVIKQIGKLNNTAEVYKIRYSDVRCMIIKKFPFMVHFLIEDESVVIFAILHTSGVAIFE